MKVRSIKRRLMKSANSFPVRVERSYRTLLPRLSNPAWLTAWRLACWRKGRPSSLTKLLNLPATANPL